MNPNVAGAGNSGSEGVLEWCTGNSVIAMGSVVVFRDVDNGDNVGFESSMGVLTVVDTGFNISASGDAIYACYGDPVVNSVTEWICGLQNSNNEVEANFNATNLNVDENYVIINNTASKDGGQYSGVREGKAIEEYRLLILDEENWSTSTTDGESILPFNSAMFLEGSLGVEQVSKNDIHVKFPDGKVIFNRGKLFGIYNILGQKHVNENLKKGLYFVTF